MSARKLPPRVSLLDARNDPQGAYFGGSMWIPLNELEARLHELPPPHADLEVPDSQPDTVAFLKTTGRQAIVVTVEPKLSKPPLTRLWHENPLLKHILKGGRALDLGCGSGRDAIAISGLGYTVQAIDWLPSALQKARELEWRTYGDNLIDWREMDLRKEAPEGQFDVITMFSFHKADLIKTAIERLNPDGRILVEMFTPEHQAAMGKPKNVVTEQELREALGQLECLGLDSGWRGDRHTVRGVWAKKSA